MSIPLLALCVCPDIPIAQAVGRVQDANARLPPLDDNMLSLNFALAATVNENGVSTTWADPAALLAQLMDTEKIISYNGDSFDLPLIAKEAAVVDAEAKGAPIASTQQLADSSKFQDTYLDLRRKSMDYLTVVRQATGSIFPLGNITNTTFKQDRTIPIMVAARALEAGNIIPAVNAVLEGAGLVAALHYVARNLRKLAVTGPDDVVFGFDVPGQV